MEIKNAVIECIAKSESLLDIGTEIFRAGKAMAERCYHLAEPTLKVRQEEAEIRENDPYWQPAGQGETRLEWQQRIRNEEVKALE